MENKVIKILQIKKEEITLSKIKILEILKIIEVLKGKIVEHVNK